MIAVPESVIRALAAAPKSYIKDVLLTALGLDSEFNEVPEADRIAALAELIERSGGGEQHSTSVQIDEEQEELPF